MSDKFKGKYRIPSNRWQFWNYSAPADYFITIIVLDRKCILGKVVSGRMELSKYGQIVADEFVKIPEYHKRVMLDEWVVMPNHVHCIIRLGDWDFDNGVSLIGDDDTCNCTGSVNKIHEFYLQSSRPPYQPSSQPTEDQIKLYRKQRRKMIIPKILGKFKMQTSKQINIERGTPETKNWQHDYHDHVIRSNRAFHHIKNYIIANPRKWDADKFHE